MINYANFSGNNQTVAVRIAKRSSKTIFKIATDQ